MPPARRTRPGRHAARTARAPPLGLRSPAASRAALQLATEDILDCRILEGQLGVHPLEFGVLRLQLPEALQLGDRRTPVLRLPGEESRPADAMLADHLRDRHPALDLLQGGHNLGLGEL
jgi:hypothetical protein